jgi:hypothetical protein
MGIVMQHVFISAIFTGIMVIIRAIAARSGHDR